jgi:hypothetical protein
MQTQPLQIPTSPNAGLGVFQDSLKYDAAVQEQGYDVVLHKSVRCACKAKQAGSFSVYCKTCGGFGLFFVSPLNTRAIIQSISGNDKQDRGNLVDLEESRATFESSIYLTELDKITVADSVSVFTEILNPKVVDGQVIAPLMYAPLEDGIEYIGYYEAATDTMKVIEPLDYSITGNRITVENSLKPVSGVFSLSIRYKHRLEFLVQRLIREESRFRNVRDVSQNVAKYAIIKKMHKAMI